MVVKKYVPAPIRANVEVTTECNYDCVHCYNPERTMNKGRTNPSRQKLMKIIDMLGNKEVFQIVLSGGEPFLKKELVFEAIKRCKRYNMDVSINTNASRIDKKTAEKLKKLQIRSLLISLPSADKKINSKVTGFDNSYDLTMAGIKNAVDAGLSVSVNVVVNKLNKNSLELTVKALSKIGVKNVHLSPFMLQKSKGEDISLSSRDFIRFLNKTAELRNKYGVVRTMIGNVPHCISSEQNHLAEMTNACSAGRGIIGISPSGEATACPHLNLSYGNVLEEGFDAVRSRMNAWRSEEYLPAECQACAIKDACAGGCRASAYYLNGKLNAKDLHMGKPLFDAPKTSRTRIKRAYRMAKRIKFRKESNGFTIHRSRPMFLTEEQMSFFLYLESLGSIEPLKIQKELGLRKNELYGFISRLEEREFLEVIRDGRISGKQRA